MKAKASITKALAASDRHDLKHGTTPDGWERLRIAIRALSDEQKEGLIEHLLSTHVECESCDEPEAVLSVLMSQIEEARL